MHYWRNRFFLVNMENMGQDMGSYFGLHPRKYISGTGHLGVAMTC